MTDDEIEIAAKQIIKKDGAEGELKTHAQAVTEAMAMTQEEVDALVEDWLGEGGR